MPTWLLFLTAALAVWRVTHLLHAERGPWALTARLRSRLGGGFFGQMVGCFKCLSVWVALPAALAVSREPVEVLLAWPALSGAAILLELHLPLSLPLDHERTPDELLR